MILLGAPTVPDITGVHYAFKEEIHFNNLEDKSTY